MPSASGPAPPYRPLTLSSSFREVQRQASRYTTSQRPEGTHAMIKKTIASIAVGGMLLVGGAALAAGTAGATTSTTPSSSSSTGTPPAHGWVKAHRHALVRDAVVLTAKDIGVTPQDLVSELKSGKSLADVAGEHNVSSQTLVNDLVTAAEVQGQRGRQREQDHLGRGQQDQRRPARPGDEVGQPHLQIGVNPRSVPPGPQPLLVGSWSPSDQASAGSASRRTCHRETNCKPELGRPSNRRMSQRPSTGQLAT